MPKMESFTNLAMVRSYLGAPRKCRRELTSAERSGQAMAEGGVPRALEQGADGGVGGVLSPTKGIVLLLWSASRCPCFRDWIRKITITPDDPVGDADADPCIGHEVGEWGHSVLQLPTFANRRSYQWGRSKTSVAHQAS